MAVLCSEIPEELVYMFVEKLVCIDDLIRSSSVCKLWKSISISVKEKKKAYSPLMMLANSENDNLPSNINGEGFRSFVIPYKNMKSFNLELPKAQGRRCWGSPYGWLVTVGLDFNITLLNPFTGEQLYLPPQSVLQNQSLIGRRFSVTPQLVPDRTISLFTRKMALGWHSSSQRWLVMAIFGTGEEVAFTFTGTENFSWTCIESTVDAEDVILFQDRVYIIAFGGELKVFDIEEGTPSKAIHIADSPKHYHNSDTFYLVEIGGNLHFVARYFSRLVKDKTTDFIVWRFNFSDKEWYELDDFGDYALFLGNNTSFAISTTTYSDFSRNCVYFTDDRYATYHNWFCDVGVYDYEEKKVKPFDIANMGAFSKFSRPTFFMPTL